jgi:hypothetical protein
VRARAVALAAAAASLLAYGAASAQHLVARDSEFMRGIYRAPVAADWARLLATREILKLARDDEGAAALDHHLQALALVQLAGQPAPPSGTLEEVIRHQAGTDAALAEQRKKLLAGSLALRLDASTGSESLLPVVIRVQNASRGAIAQFDAALRLGNFQLQCRSIPPGREVPPGAGESYACGAEHRHVPGAQLMKTVEAARASSARWEFHIARIDFVDPPVSFTPGGAYWPETPRALAAAQLDLQAAGCRVRGSCLAELKAYVRGPDNPVYALLFWGLVTAGLAALSPRRRLIAAGVLSGLFLVVWGIALALTLQQSSPLAALLVLYGPFVVLGCVAVLWSIVLVLHLLRKRGQDPFPQKGS